MEADLSIAGHVLSVEAIDEIASDILNKPFPEYPENLNSIIDLCNEQKMAIYFGVTKRTLVQEDTRWGTARGAAQGGTNRPVIQKLDGTFYCRNEMFDELGAQSRFVFFSKLRRMCREVEDELQRGIDHMHLGVHLHRFVAMGKYENDDELANPDYLCKTFVTFFPITTPPWQDPITLEWFMALNGVHVKIVH